MKKQWLGVVTLCFTMFSFFAVTAQENLTVEGDWIIQSEFASENALAFKKQDTITLQQGNFYYNKGFKQNMSAGRYLVNNKEITFFYDTPKDTVVSYTLNNNAGQNLILTSDSDKIYLQNTLTPLQSEVAPVAKSDFKIDPTKGLGITFESVYRGLIGIFFLIGLCYLYSSNRKRIDWKLVATGLALQLVIAVLVLKVPFIASIFDWISDKVVEFLNKAEAGAQFVFGALVDPSASMGYIFAFKVLPTIVFFSAFMSLLYYLGILQKIVFAFAWVMSKTMRLSGAESLAAAANIFIGQTEAPLVVKPYLDKMTKSEILCLMVGGMATIAGGVLAAFIAFLGGDSVAEQVIFTKHLLTASIMSAPAAIIIAKILYPETEEDKIDRKLVISKEKIGSNILDAIANGTTDGLRLAVNVGAMLLVFTAIMAVVNWALGDLIGEPTGLNDYIASVTSGRYQAFSMQFILGNLFAPVAWLIGVPFEDVIAVGQLLGEKTILNEFFAYGSLATLKNTGVLVNYRSIVISTYALCGFANFASIGIQIGGIGVLAPSQRAVLAKFGIKALVGGTCAALLTAVIAGIFFG